MRVPALVLAAFTMAAPAAAQTRIWSPGDRVIISDYSVVRAIAASNTWVYVATPNGLGLYDRRFRRWDPPVTWEDGYPREPVLTALADPAEDAVWLGTVMGVVRYRPQIRQFEAVTIPGGVRDLMYDRSDPFPGIYLLTSSGWELLARGSFIATPAPLPPPGRRVTPPRVEDVMRRAPVVDALQGAVLLDERLRRFHYTCAAIATDVEMYYLGTDGMGVIQVDPLVARFDVLPFGMLGVGAGAVLAVPRGVWVGTDERGPRSGITFVDDDLQDYRFEEGPRGTGFGSPAVHALMARDHMIWAGTDAGVVRVDQGGSTLRLGTVDGLPGEAVYALAQGPSGVWIGTSRGLGFLARDADKVRVLDGPGVPALALTAARDTVWIGYATGLGLAAAGSSDVFIAPGADSVPELQTAIVAVTQVADTVVVATVDRVLWRAGTGTWLVERSLAADVGVIGALAADSGGVWIGGTGGLARYGFATRAVTALRTPGDVPGTVRGIAVSRRYIWAATDAGLVRFRREAVEP
jgi:ligand-binding sensor domain-containing protein